MKLWKFFACACGVAAHLGVLAQVPMAQLREKVIEIETEPTRSSIAVQMNESAIDFPPTVTRRRLTEISENLQPDGTFKNVDYASKDRSMWKAAEHLNQCRELAIGARVYPDRKKALEGALKALDWWLEKKPKNSNWWYHSVHEAQMLGNIALLLPPEAVTPARRAALEAFLSKPKPGMTGQNRLWLCWNTVLAGLFMNEEARVKTALDEMGKVIVVAEKGQEGIQPDWSFHQHGPHFHQGNYGRHFLHSASKYLRLVSGTPLEDRSRVDVFEHLLLDGTRMMCWGGLLDYNAWGRQISYADRFQGPDIQVACRNFLAARPSRAAEVQNYMEELKRLPFDGKTSQTPRGVFAYPYSDYLAFRAADFMVGLRLASKRTIAMECVNGDNATGDFLAQGQTYIYRTGTEYRGVFPLWRWACIPGTTARNIPVKSNTGGRSPRGGNDFAVVSPDGAAAMSLDYKGVKGNKSWFFFDDRLVCLGSGITAEGDGEVLTTIEQSLLQGNAMPRIEQTRDCRFVSYNGFYWMFPAAAKSVFESGKRKGSWRPLRPANPGDEVEGRVFFLALSHGEKPKAGSYFYQVVRAEPRNKGAQTCWNDIQILRHDDACHAVRFAPTGEIKCVFFKPATLDLPGGRTVTAEKPGVKILPSAAQ